MIFTMYKEVSAVLFLSGEKRFSGPEAMQTLTQNELQRASFLKGVFLKACLEEFIALYEAMLFFVLQENNANAE